MRFNSTMVRLKAVCKSGIISDDPEFQFHNGSIKRVSLTLPHTLTLAMFQFHNGSIKSMSLGSRLSPMKLFQFHNGSIKSTEKSDWRTQRRNVSIPQWFD